MNTTHLFSPRALAASLAIAGLTVTSLASATVVEVPVEVLSPSPLGPFPTFFPNKGPGVASFEYNFQFEVAAPYLVVSASYNFNPDDGVNFFSGDVHAAWDCDGTDCKIDDASPLFTFTSTSGTELRLDSTVFSPGTYVFHFEGQSTLAGTGLSGQATAAPVSAPSVLGLLAVGLLGLGARARRRD